MNDAEPISAQSLQNLCGVSAEELIQTGEYAGLTILLTGDILTIRGPKEAKDLGAELFRRKAEVIAFLSKPADPELLEIPTSPPPLPRPAPAKSPDSPLPDPAKPFWWFSSSPIQEPKIPAGCAIPVGAGGHLPIEADYWCYEGDQEWTKIDRSDRPKTEPVPKKGTKRRGSRREVSP